MREHFKFSRLRAICEVFCTLSSNVRIVAIARELSGDWTDRKFLNDSKLKKFATKKARSKLMPSDEKIML